MKPCLRIRVSLATLEGGHAIMTVLMPRFGNDASIMTAIGQKECDVRSGQHIDLIDRTPRSDVIPLGADGTNRRFDIAQCASAALDHVPAFRQLILEKDPPQIFGVHARGHARCVGIPRHKIVRSSPLAQKLTAFSWSRLTPRTSRVASSQNC